MKGAPVDLRMQGFFFGGQNLPGAMPPGSIKVQIQPLQPPKKDN